MTGTVRTEAIIIDKTNIVYASCVVSRTESVLQTFKALSFIVGREPAHYGM